MRWRGKGTHRNHHPVRVYFCSAPPTQSVFPESRHHVSRYQTIEREIWTGTKKNIPACTVHMGHILPPTLTFVHRWPLLPGVPSLRGKVKSQRMKGLPSKLCEREDTRLVRFWPTISGAVPEGIIRVGCWIDLRNLRVIKLFQSYETDHCVQGCAAVFNNSEVRWWRHWCWGTRCPAHVPTSHEFHWGFNTTAVAKLPVPEAHDMILLLSKLSGRLTWVPQARNLLPRKLWYIQPHWCLQIQNGKGLQQGGEVGRGHSSIPGCSFQSCSSIRRVSYTYQRSTYNLLSVPLRACWEWKK